MIATDVLPQSDARYVPEITGNIRLEHLHRYLLARELAQSKTVLNIACGEGDGAALLASVAQSVIGVDPAPDAIERASRRFGRANLTFRGGSCTAIPILDASIDLVVSLETIEYETQHARMLTEVRRVLAPGGVLVLSTPVRAARAGTGDRNPFHVGALSREEFEQLLRAHFPYVSIVGQRTRAGSLVGPLDEQTYVRFLTFRHHDDKVDEVVGIEAPLCLIAVASDAPIPAVPIGLMDGADVVFVDRPPAAPAELRIEESAEALTRRVAELARLHTRERRRLAEIKHVVAGLHATIDRHRDEAQSAHEQVRIHETRIADLDRQHRVELETERATLETERAAHEQRVAALERDAADGWVRIEGLAATVRALEIERTSMQTASSAAQERWGARETELLAAIDRLTEAAAAGQETIAFMERSHSWQITRPLRELRRLISRIHR